VPTERQLRAVCKARKVAEHAGLRNETETEDDDEHEEDSEGEQVEGLWITEAEDDANQSEASQSDVDVQSEDDAQDSNLQPLWFHLGPDLH